MKIIDLSDRHNMFYWQANRKLTLPELKKYFIERHVRISEDLIKKAVMAGMEKAGFSGQDIQVQRLEGIIKRGSINTVMPVKLASGREIVIRMHPRGIKNGYFWVEKAATDVARKERVPTYTCLTVDDSNKDVPFDYMIMTREKGKPIQDFWPLDPKLDERLIRETGKYAALIHQVKTQGFGFFLNNIAKKENRLQGQYSSFREHIYAGLEADLKFLYDQKTLNEKQRKKVELLFNQNEKLLDCRSTVLVHNDIADWNQLSDGKHVIGMMDWDECVSGDPLLEYAAYSLFFGEPRLTWFREGYCEIEKLENNEEKLQLFKLRYLIAKLHIRKMRLLIDESEMFKNLLARGLTAMEEVFKYFKMQM